MSELLPLNRRLKKHGMSKKSKATPKKGKANYEIGKGKPPKSAQWKPGQSGNPTGKMDVVKRALRQLSREEHEKFVNLILFCPLEDLRKMAMDPKAPALQVMVASLVHRVIVKGDTATYDRILDRLIGPVRQSIELTQPQGPLVHITLPSNGRENVIPVGHTASDQLPILPPIEQDDGPKTDS